MKFHTPIEEIHKMRIAKNKILNFVIYKIITSSLKIKNPKVNTNKVNIERYLT